MAYNNYFPMGYQQAYPNYNQVPQNPSQAQNGAQNGMQNGIIWVQGIEGAKAYPVAVGTSIMLMDSEDSVFYVKSSDASGMPMPLRIFDYSERSTQPTPQPQVMPEYVTREEFERQIAEITKKLTPPKTKKEKKDE